ncbi:MAG: hypothetical protein ACYDCN_07215 [Bacteroidia bacterium]
MKKLISYFNITLNLVKMSIADEVNLALALVFDTDPDYTVHLYTQAQLRALATTVQTELGNRITLPNPTLTHQEQLDVNALSVALNAVKFGVVIAANKKAQGNRAMFETVASRIGFHSSKAHAKHTRVVEFKHSEKGFFDFIVPSEGHGVTYIYMVGITPTMDVLALNFQQVPLDHAELIMGGYASGTIICVKYAVQKSPAHKKATTTTAMNTQRKAVAGTNAPSGVLTILPENSKGQVVLMQGVNYWHFSNAFYFRVP